MKSPLKLVSILLMVAVMASLVFACGGTPTPPVTVPPTTTPPTTLPPITTSPPIPPPTTLPPATETPTPTAQSYSYKATIFGQDVTISTDAKGAMLTPFEKTSPDGTLTISFEAGTKITDDNVPVKQFSVTTNSNPTKVTDGPTAVGPSFEFKPAFAHIFPAMSCRFNYGSFQSQIDQVANAELKFGFLLSTGKWAIYNDYQVDTAGKTASINIDTFEQEVALLAETPKVVAPATGGPANGVDISIISLSDIVPGGEVTLTAKTVPNARVMLWTVNPSTGNRSAYPADRFKNADASGMVTWVWTISNRTISGEGRIELYVTTSTDPTFLGYFNANNLSAALPAKATDISDFQKGLIEQLELDDHTTAKMFKMTVK